MRRALFALSLGPVACSATPEPAALSAPARSTPLGAPLPVSRWERTMEHPLVGPPRPEGVFAVVGGKRMRLAPDNTVALERTGTALQIDEAALVPTPGGDVLVARSGEQLFRFDDPLGPAISMAELELGVTIHGPTFGGLFVGDPAQLLDVPSGIATSAERFGALEPLAVTFLDAKRAAAWFQIGAFTTTDGGKSWAAAEGGKPGVAGARMLATFGGVTGYGGGAKGERLVAIPFATDRAPRTAAWIALTGADPLRVAAERGTPDPAFERGQAPAAYVAHRGTLARVDLRTGAVLDFILLGFTVGSDAECEVTASTTEKLLVACRASDPRRGVVLEVSTASGEMSIDQQQRIDGDGYIRTSAAGGVAFETDCEGRTHAGLCVRQPDGGFASLEYAPSHGLPQRDGRVLVAELTHGATPAVVVTSVTPSGPTELARVALPFVADRVAILDEERPSIVVSGREGLYAGAIAPGMVIERVSGRVDFVTRGGGFVGWGDDGLLVTRGPGDGQFLVTTARLPGHARVDRVSGVGFNRGGFTRIGYGEFTNVTEPPLGARRPRDKKPPTVSCTIVDTRALGDVATQQKGLVSGEKVSSEWQFSEGPRGAIAAITTIPVAGGSRWRLKWMSHGTQWDIASAELDAPTEAAPDLHDVDVNSGVLGAVVHGVGQTWLVAATSGLAELADADEGADRVRAGMDGSIVWRQSGGLVLRARGGRAALLVPHWPDVVLSTPSTAGVRVFADRGSLALGAADGPIELAPHMFGRTPNLSDWKMAILGELEPALAACAKGSQGRTVTLPNAPVNVVVDGEQMTRSAADLEVAIDGTPCVAGVTLTVSGAPGRGTLLVDLLGGRARFVTPTVVSDLTCAWEAPVATE